jgi:hypothetical protein
LANNYCKKGAGDVTQVVEQLPGKCKDLSSNASAAKGKKKKKGRKEMKWRR